PRHLRPPPLFTEPPTVTSTLSNPRCSPQTKHRFMEKAYLQELAKQLQLAPEVIEQLEQQLR
nr:tellurite resistance TerB family protein [Vibrio vulnificus]